MSDAAVAAMLRAGGTGWRVAVLGLSVPLGNRGGWRRLGRWLRRGGVGVVPYLLFNFGLATGAGARRAAREAGVPAVRVANVNDPAFAGRLRAAGVDLLVSLHFDQVIGAACLAAVPRGGVNLHPSLLPRHRGAMPAFWALADAARVAGGRDAPAGATGPSRGSAWDSVPRDGGPGLGEPGFGEPGFGVTVHRIAPRLDAGAILARRAVALLAGLSATAAARALHDAGVAPLLEALDALAAGRGEGSEVPTLPYRPFPDRAALRAARRAGVRLLRPRDLLRRS